MRHGVGTIVRGGIAGLVALLGLGGLVVVAAAAATVCSQVGLDADLEADGHADVVVGLPDHDGGGAVDVRYTGRPGTLLRGPDVGGATTGGVGFGTALAVGDLDKDGCGDLVITGHGQVHIIFGSPEGLDPDTVLTLDGPGDDTDFGASLALGYRSTTDGTPGPEGHRYDLFVGAPGTTVAGRADAGAVWRYTLTPTPDNEQHVAAAPGTRITQDSPGVPGHAERGDRFGAELAASLSGGVVAAAPLEDVGRVADAGAVWHLHGDVSGAWTAKAEVYQQNSPGVPGRAEPGDHFGASLAAAAGYLMVGVPDEDAGRLRNSGLVHVFRHRDIKQVYQPERTIHQDVRGIPGKVEAGDRFGAGVTLGMALFCAEDEDLGLAIGAPGEDLGSRADAGAVTLVMRSPQGRCGPKVLRQGSGLNGAAEAGDGVGGELSVAIGRTDVGEPYNLRLLVGVPGEDLGTVADAGAVLSVRPEGDGPQITVDGTRVPALTFSGGAVAGTRYGQVLPTEFL